VAYQLVEKFQYSQDPKANKREKKILPLNLMLIQQTPAIPSHIIPMRHTNSQTPISPPTCISPHFRLRQF